MEVLAHISARCVRGRDERYRKQAENYAGFECVEAAPTSQTSGVGVALSSYVPFIQKTDTFITSTFLDDTQEAVAALESQIITSSLNALLPSSLDEDITFSNIESQFADIQRSSEPAGTAVSSSKSPDRVTLSDKGADQGNGSATTSPAKRSHASTWSEAEENQDLPSTYEVSNDPQDSVARQEIPSSVHLIDRIMGSVQPILTEHNHHANSDHEPIPVGFHKDSPTMNSHLKSVRSRESTDTDTDKPDPKRRKVSASSSNQPERASRRHSTPARSLQADSSDSLFEQGGSPTFIRPPVPPTAVSEQPPTFASTTLIKLKEAPELANCYPSRAVTTRAIRPGERGYWAFHPHSKFDKQWTKKVATEMWRSLRQYIESGALGWGVWLVRIPPVHATATESEQPEEVRVFCWGEVVEHVFLLLYTLSFSRVKRFSPVWRDAEGKEVVTIGPRNHE